MIWLTAEFLAIFVALPLLIYYRRLPNYPIPMLLLAAGGAFLYLLASGYPRAELTSWGDARPHLPALLVRDAILSAGLGVCVWIFARGRLFSLIRRSPLLWALVFVMYPLISVYPQELLYRTFFFHRYEPLFGTGWGMITASALAFGFVHIIFRHWLPVSLCFVGGFLFAYTYHVSGSLLLACLDHAIFGNFLFTIGLGDFFYHGSLRTLSRGTILSPKAPASR